MSNSCSMLEQDFMQVLLSKAKASYTIVDKISGEVLGHALMVTEDSLSPEHLQLQPLQADDRNHGDDQPKQPVVEKVSEWSNSLAPATLASDLDISEDSSVNITEEDKETTCQNNVKREIPESSDISSREDTNKNISDTGLNEIDDDIQIIHELRKNPTSSVSVASSSGSFLRSSETMTISTEVAEKDPRKFKSTVSYPGKIFPGMPGSLSVFYTDEGVTQPIVPKYKKHKLVKCLLCNEETIVAVSNFGSHLLAHQQPVECDICGKKLGGQSMKRHKKICQAIKDQVKGHATVDKSKSTKSMKTGEEVRFKLICAVDPEKKVKILLKKNSKIKKAKKKFGKRYNLLNKSLKLVHRGIELTGDELACQLEGEEIIVHE